MSRTSSRKRTPRTKTETTFPANITGCGARNTTRSCWADSAGRLVHPASTNNRKGPSPAISASRYHCYPAVPVNAPQNRRLVAHRQNGNSAQYENLEAHGEITELVVFYSRNLAVPARRDHDDPDVLAGKKVFYDIGCIQCHTPKYVTRKDSIGIEQSRQLI